MGRSQKNNADWFQHKTNFANDRRVVAAEIKFGGNDPYAVCCRLKEYIASHDFFKIPWDETEAVLLSGVAKVEADRFVEIMNFLIKARMFVVENGYLVCPDLISNLDNLVQIREQARERKRHERDRARNKQTNLSRTTNDIVTHDNSHFSRDNGIVTADCTTDSIVSYSILRKEEDIYNSKGVNTIPKCDENARSLANNFSIPSLEEIMEFLTSKYPSIENIEGYARNYYEKRKRRDWHNKHGTKILDWRADLVSWIYWDKTEKFNEVYDDGINSRNSKITESDFSGVKNGFQ